MDHSLNKNIILTLKNGKSTFIFHSEVQKNGERITGGAQTANFITIWHLDLIVE